ncbi:membrane-spanning 4-domains subfamily A member 12-like [Tubulanus polymorphus]|uniref:membrane-spanning 4-domains subfamily A member 12-like n=1 Tax=Tubulanus polymorphus TaxID=672921 RepID=UPI003DA24D1A
MIGAGQPNETTAGIQTVSVTVMPPPYPPMYDHEPTTIIQQGESQVQVLQPRVQSHVVKAHEKEHTIMGSLQICTGVITFITHIVYLLSFPYGLTSIGYGIWGGILCVVAGSLGIACRKGSRCLTIGCLVLCIVSAIACFFIIVFSSISLLFGGFARYRYRDGGGRASDSILLLFGVLEMIVAIVESAYCCHSVCRAPAQYYPVIMHVNHPPPNLVTDNTNFENNPPPPPYTSMGAEALPPKTGN